VEPSAMPGPTPFGRLEEEPLAPKPEPMPLRR